MISVTPTKLSDYLICPLKFKFKHVEKTGGVGSSAAFSFGTSMHRALQVLHKEKMPPASVPDPAELLGKFWNSAEYANKEEDRSYFLRGCRAIEEYCETAFDDPGETIGTETYMSFVIECRGSKLRLGCKADRLTLHKDNVLEIVDYKTSQSGRIPTPEFVRGDLATFMYYVLTRLTYPQYPNIKFSYLNVMSGAKVSVDYDRSLIDENKRALWESLKTIADGNYAPRNSECCAWCDFQDVCPLTNKIIDFGSI